MLAPGASRFGAWQIPCRSPLVCRLPSIGSYWWLLVAIGGCWWLLLVIGGYWRLLAVVGGYCWLLVVIGGYWRLLVVIGGYWWFGLDMPLYGCGSIRMVSHFGVGVLPWSILVGIGMFTGATGHIGWFGARWFGGEMAGVPCTLYKNQGSKSPNHQSNPPNKGYLILEGFEGKSEGSQPICDSPIFLTHACRVRAHVVYELTAE